MKASNIMKAPRILVCLVLLNFLNNIYCSKNSKYFSTFGDLVIDYSESGSKIQSYVTLQNDIKSNFSEGRF